MALAAFTWHTEFLEFTNSTRPFTAPGIDAIRSWLMRLSRAIALRAEAVLA